METNVSRSLAGLLLAALCCGAALADSVTIYTNQAAWQSALASQGDGTLNVNFDPANWTESTGSTGPEDSELIESTMLPGWGTFSIASDCSFGCNFPPPLSFVNGSIDTIIGNRTSQIWTLGGTAYGFGAYITTSLPGFANTMGVDIEDSTGSFHLDNQLTGFVGVISSAPIAPTIYFSPTSCDPFGPICPTVLDVTDLQFVLPTPAPNSTPEPNFAPMISAFAFAIMIGRKVIQQSRTTCSSFDDSQG